MMTKVVFLDIDGVIAPTESSKFPVLKPDKKGKYDQEYYHTMASNYQKKNQMDFLDGYDMYIVETGWSLTACNRIRQLLKQTNSKIVMESSWIHAYGKTSMPGLLKMVHLDQDYIDIAPGNDKLDGIQRYLKNHPEVDDFVIIDDEDYWNLSKQFGYHLIRTNDYFNDEDFDLAKMILDGAFEYKIDANSFNISVLNNLALIAKYHLCSSDHGQMLLVDQVVILNLNLQRLLMRFLIQELSHLAFKLDCDDGYVLVAKKAYFNGIKIHFWYNLVLERLNINHKYLTNDDQATLIHSEYSPYNYENEWKNEV